MTEERRCGSCERLYQPSGNPFGSDCENCENCEAKRLRAEVARLTGELAEAKEQIESICGDAEIVGYYGGDAESASTCFRVAYERLTAELAARTTEQDEARKVWRCFHCGFETSDATEAQAHFGEDLDESALCLEIARWGTDETAKQLQQTLIELSGERDETSRQRAEIEGLEYRLLDFESLLGSRFPNCRTINDAFNLYDSMEGRALAAEERVEKAERERDGLDREANILTRENDNLKASLGRLREERDGLAAVLKLIQDDGVTIPKSVSTILAAHDAAKAKVDPAAILAIVTARAKAEGRAEETRHMLAWVRNERRAAKSCTHTLAELAIYDRLIAELERMAAQAENARGEGGEHA